MMCHLPCLADSTIYGSDSLKHSFLDRLNAPRKVIFRNDTAVVKLRWLFPDYLKLQFAGFSGFLSIGAGYNIRKIYDISFHYGLLSNTLGRSKVTVHTLSLKNSFNIALLWNHLIPKAGLYINYGYTNNTFKTLPVHYPDKYYFQNQIHLAPFFGAEFRMNLPNRYLSAGGFYAELVSLDSYILESLRTRFVKFNHIWSLCLGATIYLF